MNGSHFITGSSARLHARSAPRSSVLAAALRSALSLCPHAAQTKTGWLSRFRSSTVRQGAQVREVNDGSTDTNRAALQASMARIRCHPTFGIARFNPRCRAMRGPGSSTLPFAERVMCRVVRSLSTTMPPARRVMSVVDSCAQGLRPAPNGPRDRQPVSAPWPTGATHASGGWPVSGQPGSGAHGVRSPAAAWRPSRRTA